jgi:DinB family
MTSTAALTPESAEAVWSYLLPQVQASRQVTRLMIQNFPANKLDARPLPQGETLGDMVWYLASVFHVFLEGVCEGEFAPMPAAPQPASTAAYLTWDEERFNVTLQKLALLSGEQLLRPVTFAGVTQTALGFVSSFLAHVSQQVGQLSAYLSMVTPVASPAADDSAELSEDELSSVAGGNMYILPPSSSSGSYAAPYTGNIQVTANYNAPSPIMVQTQAGLGSLLGSGGGGIGAVGAVGGAALIAGMLGINAASIAIAGGTAGLIAGKTAITVAFILSRF